MQHRTSQISNGNLRLIRLSFTSSLKDTVSKYKCKLKDGDKDLDETIKIDSKKETETFQTASNGGTSPDVPGEVEVIYDFKQVSERGGVGGLGILILNCRFFTMIVKYRSRKNSLKLIFIEGRNHR